jgi:hypothetical protein
VRKKIDKFKKKLESAKMKSKSLIDIAGQLVEKSDDEL